MIQKDVILQQYCFPYNCGNCYTHSMSLNNILKKKQLHFQFLLLLTIKLNYLHELKIMFQCLPRSKNTSCKVNNSFMLKFGVGVIRAYKGPKNMYFSIANSFFWNFLGKQYWIRSPQFKLNLVIIHRIILQQYCFPYNCGYCYTHNMSLNNILKKKQLHFQFLLLLTIKLNYLHDLKIMFQCLLHLNMYM
jgi:hypothetical protein